MRGLYIHIPFCNNVCNYCDFHKRVPKDLDMINTYLSRLVEELDQYKPYFNSIRTIYIGGGTPSMLNITSLEYLLANVAIFPEIIEFSFEANPESLTEEKIALLAKYGVNRVSLGVQTFKKESLDLLGRKHTPKNVIDCINLLKKHNITNINIDLMFAIPYQNLNDIKYDLNEFYKLNIPHISYYSLILEEKTYFYQKYSLDELELVSNDLEASMFEYIIDDLKNHEYKHYEISNFTKDKESVHNKIYWQNKEYIGIGMGASGYLDGIRYDNSDLVKTYMQDFVKTKYELTLKDKINEEFMLGLRLIDGINIKEINEKYKIDALEMYPEIKKFIEYGFLEYNGYLKFSQKGLMHGNDIFEKFTGSD